MAMTAIRRNAFRSFLTTLGIVIGVASVIAMISLGRGATQKVTQDISSLGNNLLIVFPGTERRSVTNSNSAPFTVDDARAIREEVSGIAGVAPSSGVGGRLVYGNRNWNCGGNPKI